LSRRQNAALTASKAHSRSKFEFAKRHSAVPARQKSARKTQSDRLLAEKLLTNGQDCRVPGDDQRAVSIGRWSKTDLTSIGAMGRQLIAAELGYIEIATIRGRLTWSKTLQLPPR
jgi:hypothetical protein